MTVTVATLGFPRIGPRRELKFALENYWAGKSSQDELLTSASGLRTAAWARQHALGADWLPSNDFSLYDHVLDTSVMLGVVPERHAGTGDALTTYFAMARGTAGKAEAEGCGCAGVHGSVTACEMTKWFDTNYHYLVPELREGQAFTLNARKLIDEYREAKALGYETRPVLLGPVTWLSLAKGEGVEAFDYLDQVLQLYMGALAALAEAGAEWVQIDEPALVLDLDERQRSAFVRAYARLARAPVKIMLTTYFGPLGNNLGLATGLPVAGLHVDLVRAPGQLDAVLANAPATMLLSLGVIDGRNVWRADLDVLADRLAPVAAQRDIIVAPSCSLLHVPIDLALEANMDLEVAQWLSFAVQKIEELDILKRALNEGRDSVAEQLKASSEARRVRENSPRIHNSAVQERMAALSPTMLERRSPYTLRKLAQEKRLNLPLYPTTTIGSFPQTAEVRHARAEHNRGRMHKDDYEAFLREETARAIRWQEDAGIDMLVHGEFERNDMVQYFGEQLAGFVFTVNGWVQSYGSRCVRPPILYGDVAHVAPMTVDWWRYAQSLTEKPVKGMLTGPVTILNWSFVRDDQPRAQSCRQIALAIRDEVMALEAAGCQAIQVDEAALREGLPLRAADKQEYLDWAVECFRLATAGVADDTQIHTHMCYSEFNEILPAIAAMDADVLSIETARSQMELLGGFAEHHYPSGIGPGVYDIHTPRIPTEDEMVTLIKAAARHLAPDQLWVNPDCGLKTRKWPEVEPAIAAMVAAARRLRSDARQSAEGIAAQ